MALVFLRVLETAQTARALADQLAALHAKIHTFLEFNSDQAIDWGAGSTPAYITEDADGNIEGVRFSRQDVANVIGSFDQLRRLLTSQSVSTGDHLGNLNKLSQPLPLRQ